MTANSIYELLELARQTTTEVLPHELEALRAGGDALIIDVREPEEHERGVVPGAALIPRGLLELHIERLAPKRSTPIVLYCEAGVRSLLAARSLGALGYTNVASLAGGTTLYARKGYALERPGGLTPAQKARYSRHLRLPEVGEAGQQKLLASRVLCVGAGGLGSPIAMYLAAAGVGTLGIVDADVVDLSNLQRQLLHTSERVGMSKVDSAQMTLRALNSDTKVVGHRDYLTSANAMAILGDYDVVIDGTDNFPTRYLLNDACVLLAKPCVHGAIHRFEGQSTVFHSAEGGPCYRCLYPAPPPPGLVPSCQEAGVLGVLPGIIGMVQAIETIKLILGVGDLLTGRLLVFDALGMDFRELLVHRDKTCPMCGDNPSIAALIDYEAFCSGRP